MLSPETELKLIEIDNFLTYLEASLREPVHDNEITVDKEGWLVDYKRGGTIEEP